MGHSQADVTRTLADQPRSRWGHGPPVGVHTGGLTQTQRQVLANTGPGQGPSPRSAGDPGLCLIGREGTSGGRAPTCCPGGGRSHGPVCSQDVKWPQPSDPVP